MYASPIHPLLMNLIFKPKRVILTSKKTIWPSAFHPSSLALFLSISVKDQMKTAKLERKNMPSRRLRQKIDFQIFVFFAFQTEMDFGSLVCWATNSIGRQTQPCVFHLTPAGRPDPVTNCTVTKQSYSTMRVMCKPGFDGGLKQVRPNSNRKQGETI